MVSCKNLIAPDPRTGHWRHRGQPRSGSSLPRTEDKGARAVNDIYPSSVAAFSAAVPRSDRIRPGSRPAQASGTRGAVPADVAAAMHRVQDPKRDSLQLAMRAVVHDLERVLTIIGVPKEQLARLVKGYSSMLESSVAHTRKDRPGARDKADAKSAADAGAEAKPAEPAEPSEAPREDGAAQSSARLGSYTIAQATTRTVTTSESNAEEQAAGGKTAGVAGAAVEDDVSMDLAASFKNVKFTTFGTFRGHHFEVVLADDVNVAMTATENMEAAGVAASGGVTAASGTAMHATQSLTAKGGIYIQLDGASREDVEDFCSNLSVSGMKGNTTAVVAAPGSSDFNGLVTLHHIDAMKGPGSEGIGFEFKVPMHSSFTLGCFGPVSLTDAPYASLPVQPVQLSSISVHAESQMSSAQIESGGFRGTRQASSSFVRSDFTLNAFV